MRNSKKPAKPDVGRMAEAIADFLRAAGFDSGQSKALRETPNLVAEAWAYEFLDGYQCDPLEILRRERIRSMSPGVVALDAVHFVGVCPHHLLPYRGTARIAYVSSQYIAGFGAFVQALDALAHRFILQEQLAKDLACTLREALGASGVLVRLEAEQNCLSLRGENRPGARTICESFVTDESVSEPKDCLDQLRGAFIPGVR